MCAKLTGAEKLKGDARPRASLYRPLPTSPELSPPSHLDAPWVKQLRLGTAAKVILAVVFLLLIGVIAISGRRAPLPSHVQPQLGRSSPPTEWPMYTYQANFSSVSATP
jgi:hypothetical protein